MEGHPIEAALPLAQTVVSPVLQSSSSGGLCAKPRERMKTPAFLSNLGKPTLRGIRKCPQCGIYNGTRGLSCKNKACGAVFRDGTAAGTRRSAKKGGGGGSEVVRIVTDGGGGGDGAFVDGGGGGGGSSSSSAPGPPQVFSLRQRGRGPEQRGFVELTLTDTAIATTDGTLLTRLSLGRCFLPACRRQQQQQQQQQQQGQRGVASSCSPPPSSSSSSTPPQASDSPCGHVRQAMECPTGQVATPLPLKSSVLEELPVPAQTRQELWRLATDTPGPLVQRVSRSSLVVKCHATETQALGLLHCTVGGAGTKGESGGLVFRCACQHGGGGGGVGGRGAPGVKVNSLGSLGSSDDKETALADISPLSAEGTTQCLHFYACVCAFASNDKLAVEFAHFLSYTSNGLEVSVGSSALCASDTQPVPEPITPHRTKRLKAEEPITGNNQPVDEAHVSLPFQQWLASVNEKIQQSMHYQFSGKPEPLVFHIPQNFFNALQQRLSLGSKKRRLPNSTTAFVRQDALPLGSFSKYTWHITNLMHVKQIFDTPELPLKLTQSFVRNSDGSYSPFTCPEVPAEPLSEAFGRTDRPQAIRPLELNTFLKVGICTPGQKEPTPFVIEWIPDILPRSRVGELRLRFEYGHQPTSPTEH
ncbi:uncharacterized protein C2orf42 homolog isoform X2 [Alosa pseudoharengus]|uniref:uncharacterized protein C2orf42 homolog isoform X2 n=1 Tax=Alosa pseudoharengus TaxID=34774 RepID=UPI003F8B1635